VSWGGGERERWGGPSDETIKMEALFLMIRIAIYDKLGSEAHADDGKMHKEHISHNCKSFIYSTN
jgi:hypothetical protein